ncbi:MULTISPECIES: hypothetical protein [Zoogloea]|jgi:hypothetical protein|uniref:hypothetical protein n=1 Tax=Zoogloea TaxID=349 RepID=UPI001B612817|nr:MULTISPECIES: hypothetical protein [Zoogloea]MBP6801530.1 hypothetical protein [Zoogloea sp.]MDD2669269.1 hypothetical protein [Zoogloea sp.]MDY0036524.1 hypothetical protein [Zoogloea oleivorans]
MSLHFDLATRIDETYGERLEGPAEVKLDALVVRLDNGVTLEARIAAPNAYAIAWAWGEAELRIDTAPVHKDLATFPNHLHAADGKLYHDPLTRCGAAPWDNLRAVIDCVLNDPLLEDRVSTASARS